MIERSQPKWSNDLWLDGLRGVGLVMRLGVQRRPILEPRSANRVDRVPVDRIWARTLPER
jgi:hypothetical protein